MRIRRTRSGPTKRAMLALTASLSGRVDVVARRGDDIGDVAKPEYKDVEDTTETPKGRVLDDVGEAGGGLRRSGGRDLNHASVRTSDVDSFDGDSFRLRLHWEEGYFWQEYKEEMWWCMREFFFFLVFIRVRPVGCIDPSLARYFAFAIR